MIKYKLLPNFLSKEDNNDLLQFSLNVENWNQSSTFNDVVVDWRKSKVASLEKKDGSILIDKIEAMFPELHEQFYGKKKDIEDTEIQLTRSHDGDFYKPHPDTGGNEYYEARRVTFVYYMHKLPKQFINGNIRIYDEVEDPIPGRMYDLSKYVEFEPLNNTLLLFPSHQWHEVRPVRCAMDWTYSRFTINGWMH
jgi:Rps23 Pro-64 3,4-dihydroxylase Tpa1-like proline 4-hydroxylase